MKYLFFARHGETIWNVENKICGATDIPLTERGREQAEELGRLIRDDPDKYPIDQILASPLSRARDTAEAVARATGIPMRVEPRLTEQNFGKYESTPRDGEEFAERKSWFLYRFGGGESMAHLAQRIYNLLDDIARDPSGKNYLLVAHNGITRVVASYFREMTNEEFARYGIRNCEILRFQFPEND